MLPKSMKTLIKKYMKNDCDDIIVDIMKEKLDVSVKREGDNIKFLVKFSGEVITEDSVKIKP